MGKAAAKRAVGQDNHADQAVANLLLDFCPANSFCIGAGHCCPDSVDEATCLADLGLTAAPGASSATDVGSPTASPTAASNSGASGQVVGVGVLAIAIGGAAMLF